MKVKTFELGPLQTNTYVLWDEDTREAIVVDPADEPDTILGFLKDNNLTLKYIFLTHAHFDHVGAVPEIKEATKVPLLLHKEELYIYEAARDMAAFWG
ncbi:MAG: MBL fold metallo-hydrolase, partial [Nitrospirae bacterium]